MEDDQLPLEEIRSSANLVVYSTSRRLLISENTTRGEALEILATLVKQEPETDAAIYERGQAWICILRCPEAHERWYEEASQRFLKKESPH